MYKYLCIIIFKHNDNCMKFCINNYNDAFIQLDTIFLFYVWFYNVIPGATSVGDPVAMQYYASFPVDVIVYFHMQPSTFRFSCLPVSRVECMLQLPSVDIVFSSKRSTPSQG